MIGSSVATSLSGITGFLNSPVAVPMLLVVRTRWRARLARRTVALLRERVAARVHCVMRRKGLKENW